MKKVSIVTVNFNNADGLRKTLASVASQTCLDIEHIIVDADSTDGSVEIIRAYEKQLYLQEGPVVKWSSEKDAGIYDGMNKGIAKTSGEYLLFLNSGDTLASNNVIEQIIKEQYKADFVIGSVGCYKEDNLQAIRKAPRNITLFSFYIEGICHQATLIKHSMFEQYGFYDLHYRICADWAFFMKTIIINNCSVENTDIMFCHYDLNGISSTQQAKLLSEREHVLKELLPKRIAIDYQSVFPHYYEVYRIGWLLRHPAWYRIYRMIATLGRKLLGER